MSTKSPQSLFNKMSHNNSMCRREIKPLGHNIPNKVVKPIERVDFILNVKCVLNFRSLCFIWLVFPICMVFYRSGIHSCPIWFTGAAYYKNKE